MSTIVFKGTRSSRSNASIYRWVRRVLTDYRRFAVEFQPDNAGQLGNLEDRGQVGFGRDPVARCADVEDTAAVGRIGVDRQVVVGQFRRVFELRCESEIAANGSASVLRCVTEVFSMRVSSF